MTDDQPSSKPDPAASPPAHDQKATTPTTDNSKKFTQVQGAQPSMPTKSTRSAKTFLIAFIVVTLGVGSGYLLSKVTQSSTIDQPTGTTGSQPEDIQVGKVYGSSVNGFADEAEGVLIHGGNNGEGTHRLLRPDGESQIICLTSSVLDLDRFVDHEIKIAGETFDTQKCGWFMDVGRIEVLELNAEKPFEIEPEEAL